MDFHNESVEEVKRNHQDAFAIALRTKSIFEEFYNHDIPIEEVTYIALHIAAAIERSKKNLLKPMSCIIPVTVRLNYSLSS